MQKDKTYIKFIKWANKIGTANLVRCSSGNLSHKYDDTSILVSESRQWLENLKIKNIVRVSLEDGNTLNGINPTGELPLHLEVYNANAHITTVLHCQSPAATALACSQMNTIDYNVIIEVPIYLGEIAVLPYIMPGSVELGQAVGAAAKSASVIQLQNHGQVIVGNSFKEVYQKAMFFEFACDIILRNNYKVNILSTDVRSKLNGYR